MTDLLVLITIFACFAGAALIVWTIHEWTKWGRLEADPSTVEGTPPRRASAIALAEVVALLRRPGTFGAFGGRLTAYRSACGALGASLVLGDLVVGLGLDWQSARRPARLSVRPELIVGRQVLSLDVEATLWRLTPWVHASLIHMIGEVDDGQG